MTYHYFANKNFNQLSKEINVLPDLYFYGFSHGKWRREKWTKPSFDNGQTSSEPRFNARRLSKNEDTRG